MHYSRHRLTALVACATIVLYTVADDHYVRPACLLVGVSETKPFLVQFGYIFYTHLYAFCQSHHMADAALQVVLSCRACCGLDQVTIVLAAGVSRQLASP